MSKKKSPCRKRFDVEMQKFSKITKAVKKNKPAWVIYPNISYPFNEKVSPGARLEKDFFEEYDYQRTLLNQRAYAAIKKSFGKFGCVSGSLTKLRGVCIGDTSFSTKKTENEGVTITLETPFVSIYRDTPVKGRAWCMVAMDRISLYAKSGGPSVCLECTIGIPDESSSTEFVRIWIQDQTMEQIFAEFKQKIRVAFKRFKKHT